MGKFRIKISSTWFSEDYIVLKYSTNGIFWKTIREYEYDSLAKWCYMNAKIISFSSAEYVLNKFKTLEDVIKFEDEQRMLVNTQNKEISERNKKHKKERDDVYKKYS